MAKCDLVVELDEPDRVYRSEEMVQGKVHVDVDSDVKCSGLVISCGWKTHGRGNVAMGKAEEETVPFSLDCAYQCSPERDGAELQSLYCIVEKAIYRSRS